MPTKFVKAKVFLKYKGQTIYHTYRHDNIDEPSQYWFTTNVDNTDWKWDNGLGGQFDIRDVPGFRSTNTKSAKRLLIKTIDSGKLLPVSEAFAAPCESK